MSVWATFKIYFGTAFSQVCISLPNGLALFSFFIHIFTVYCHNVHIPLTHFLHLSWLPAGSGDTAALVLDSNYSMVIRLFTLFTPFTSLTYLVARSFSAVFEVVLEHI